MYQTDKIMKEQDPAADGFLSKLIYPLLGRSGKKLKNVSIALFS